MAKVTFIHRLDTVGGLAPAASACDAGHVGTVARIGYSATYFFYEARQGNSDGPAASEDERKYKVQSTKYEIAASSFVLGPSPIARLNPEP